MKLEYVLKPELEVEDRPDGKLPILARTATTLVESSLEAMLHLFVHSSIDLDNEHLSDKGIWDNLIKRGANIAVMPFTVGYCLTDEYLGIAMAGSFAVTRGHSFLKWTRDKIRGVEKPEQMDVDLDDDDFEISTLEKCMYIPLTLGLMWGYGASIAVTHYLLTPSTSIEQKEVAPHLNNVFVDSCSLNNGDQILNFDVLGEFHIYNATAHDYVDRLLETGRIDTILSEGEKRTTDDYTAVDWLYFGLTPFIKGIDGSLTSLTEAASKHGVNMVLLEKSVNGIREGVSPVDEKLLYVIGFTSLVYAPELYFFGVGMENRSVSIGVDQLGSMLNWALPLDLIHERNKLMEGQSYEYISEHPTETTLLRVGSGHYSGMMELFAKRGSLTCTRLGYDLNPIEDE